MAYSESILSRAEARLKQAQQAHRDRQDRQRRAIYQALPRTEEIDRQLRTTAPKILAASLRQGLGREETLAKLRRENLALQDEEAALLHEAGYPPDALDETPFCPLCNDRGWKGPKMCSCLKSLCQQEQIAELSSLLDLGDQSFNTPGLAGVSPLAPREHGDGPELLPELRGVLRHLPPQKPLPLRRTGPGQDLSLRLHRPRGLGKGLFCGL